MSVKRIMAGVILGMAVLVMAGCGNKNDNSNLPAASSQNSTKKAAESEKNQINDSQKMPKATGNVDDTIDAITEGGTKEEEAATSTDAEAAGAVGNEEDINNLNNTYDEDAL